MKDLAEAASASEPGHFGAARRRFYRSLLLIGGNRELQRIFPAIGIHIIHAQYPSTRLQGIRLADRSEEHTSELQSLMRISYAVFCLKKKKTQHSNDLHNE